MPATKPDTSTSTNELCDARVIHAARVKRAWRQDLPQRKLEAVSRFFKALGDPTRLRIVLALARGEMCVCDLAAYLRISESAVSHQLRKLRDLALVRSRREGQVLYYSLDDEHVATLVSQAMVHVEHVTRR